MPIYKKHRGLSEKTTSIEDPIEVKQRGIISFVPSKGRTFLIPTHIGNPVNLKLQAMSDVTAQALGASAKCQTWYCDLSLHYATNAASSGFGSIASTVLLAEVSRRLRLKGSKLYEAVASMAAGSASNAVVGASNSLWRELPEYASGTKKFLVVTMPNSASTYFKAKKQTISFEVIGYEY